VIILLSLKKLLYYNNQIAHTEFPAKRTLVPGSVSQKPFDVLTCYRENGTRPVRAYGVLCEDRQRFNGESVLHCLQAGFKGQQHRESTSNRK
jgi:hypothetical protein